MTSTLPVSASREPAPALTVDGQRISFTAARVVITVQRVTGISYTVTCYQGGAFRLDELCSAWTSEAIARRTAWIIAVRLRSGQTAERVARAINCGCRGAGRIWIGMNASGPVYGPCADCATTDGVAA